MVTANDLPGLPDRQHATGRNHDRAMCAVYALQRDLEPGRDAAQGVRVVRSEAVPDAAVRSRGVSFVEANRAPGTVDGRGLVRGGVRA
jgi:hypothetical protein